MLGSVAVPGFLLPGSEWVGKIRRGGASGNSG